MKIVQFYPNRIVITNKKDRRVHSMPKKSYAQISREKSNKNLGSRKSTTNLSAASKRNIRDSINSMYVLSKPRTIKLPNNKFIYNYRQSFITLTLPSKQKHSDVEIKKCLNNFLTSLRQSIGIVNYVWKAELQKNENIHFHLVVDKYCSYQAIRHYWNKAINTLGYVNDYSKKMSALSKEDYAELRGLPFLDVKDAYVKGCRSNWSSPNTVDVKSVFTERNVSNYLSKYFAKSDDSDIDSERVENFGKVWARSRSLSKLKYRNKFEIEEIKEYLYNVSKNIKACFVKIYDFATVYYINIASLKEKNRRFFNFMIRNNAKRYNYPFPHI